MKNYIPIEASVTRRATVKHGNDLHTFEMSMRANILNPEHSTEVLVEMGRTLDTLIMEQAQAKSNTGNGEVKQDDSPITDKQKNLFRQLDEEGMADDIVRELKRIGKPSIIQLTKREASILLTSLMERKRCG